MNSNKILHIIKKKCNQTKSKPFIERVRKFVTLFQIDYPDSKEVEIVGGYRGRMYHVIWKTSEDERRMITIEREEDTTHIKEIKDTTESLKEFERNNTKMRFLHLTNSDLQNLMNINEVKEYIAISRNNNYMRNLLRGKLVEMIKEDKSSEFTKYTYRITSKGENYISSLLSIKVEY